MHVPPHERGASARTKVASTHAASRVEACLAIFVRTDHQTAMTRARVIQQRGLVESRWLRLEGVRAPQRRRGGTRSTSTTRPGNPTTSVTTADRRSQPLERLSRRGGLPDQPVMGRRPDSRREGS
jgi:hypothetical protein